jgi:hypothetical protein
MKGKLLNLGNLHFDIVSDLELRISDFANLGISTTVENPLQIGPFFCKTNPISKRPNERNMLSDNVLRTKNYVL